jgi:hypothetical protein
MVTTLDRKKVRHHLEKFDLRSLFVEELGWDHGGENTEVTVAGRLFSLRAIAHKRGMVAYQYVAPSDDTFPDYPTRQKIEKAVAKSVREHIIVYEPPDRACQYWQWVKREPGQPDRPRLQIYHRGKTGEPLIQRLEHLAFTLDEEDDLTIVDVSGRVRAAFDVERVTKRFYDRFKAEHDAFLGFIQGIQTLAEREWYASLMLNRMMFIYFIQKRGFLDGDRDYLRNRLERMQQERGTNRFLSFYRLFLLRLFHEGLGQPETDRAPELADLLGQVPYLNGGLFDVHDLERDHPDIQIPDKAFQRVFDFFDAYQWHLDDRPLRKDNEINPDVLGYIFEKYVNQKQMGAYYTKEDITGYISRNTVIPFLFDQARKECPIAFKPEGGVWRLLQDDPDRYFHDAVRHGITYDVHRKQDLEAKQELPSDIAASVDDVSKRAGWNSPAPAEYALPTETWREHVARRQRYEEVRAKLAAGEVRSINDLITYNLDIEKFAQDVIAQSEGPELVRAFWKAINRVSVLGPTCGSGAFLFAALSILEPLYVTCLAAMRGFLDDLERSGRKHHPETMSDFRKVLGRVATHASERYFILKTIVIGNLYGVDIMEEAVEICKLRLFLKLVAQLESYDQIEPLPDIDFNIRAGNTLVGFASRDEIRNVLGADLVRQLALQDIEERAEIADRAFRKFREMQTEHGMQAGAFSTPKIELRARLDDLRAELDRFLADEYGIKVDDREAYGRWRASHQPFHWLVEFYGIMHNGGFDVIIGNPPYVEYRKVRSTYKLLEGRYQSESAANLYAFCMERCCSLVGPLGEFGMIVPAGAMGLDDARSVRTVLFRAYSQIYCSTYAIRPAKLFDGVDQRLCILLGRSVRDAVQRGLWTTRYHHWHSVERAFLFGNIRYSKTNVHQRLERIPQIGDDIAKGILKRLEDQSNDVVSSYYAKPGQGFLMHYHRSPRYWIRAMDFEQYFKSQTRSRSVHHFRNLYFRDDSEGKFIGSILNSSLFFLWFSSMGNGRNITSADVEEFPVGAAPSLVLEQVSRAFDTLMINYKKNSFVRVRSDCEFQEFRPSLSKPLIDRIDALLADHYSLSNEELDFVTNYEIKYRMGREEPEDDA